MLPWLIFSMAVRKAEVFMLQWHFTYVAYAANGEGKLSCAKTAEPDEMSFGFWVRMCPGNQVLDGSPVPPWEWTILRGKGMPRHARRHSDLSWAKTAEPIDMPIGLRTRLAQETCIRCGVQKPMRRGNFRGRSYPSYVRTVCSNRLSCRISNFDSSQYLIYMQLIWYNSV